MSAEDDLIDYEDVEDSTHDNAKTEEKETKKWAFSSSSYMSTVRSVLLFNIAIIIIVQHHEEKSSLIFPFLP